MTGAASGTKAAKILRRTLSGGALTAVVAGLLWVTAKSGDERFVLWASAVVLLGAVLEASRMGLLRGLGLELVLGVPAAYVVLLQHAALSAGEREGSYAPSAAIEYGAALVLAVLVLGMLRCLARLRLDAPLARAALVLVLAALFFVTFRDPGQTGTWVRLGLVPIAIVAALALPAVLASRNGARDLVIVAGLALWVIPPLPALWRIGQAWGIGGLVSLLVLSKIGDSAGYYVGSAIGRSHPFPRISPGKTTAGCVASLAAGTLAGMLLAQFGVLPAGPARGALAGAATNLASQAGDLLESWVKRRAGVKDSSGVFGPSGGLLDQIDSVLLSIPISLWVWPWIFSPTVPPPS